MHRPHSSLRLAAALAACALAAWAPAAAQLPEEFTNLQVLPKDISQRELIDTMRGFCAALDVRCSHCHVGEEGQPLSTFDFAADDKHDKRAARLMLKMTRAINEEYVAALEEKKEAPVEVRCATCHRGQEHPRLIQDVLAGALEMGGAEAVESTYRELRAEYYGRHTYDFGEVVLNNMAFDLARERPEDALALLALNAEFFPDSPAVEHLFGEIYAVQGEAEKAIRHLERSLALDPENPRARHVVEQLRNPAPKGEPGGSPAAADWPQWRGPERHGRSAETGLLAEWPEGGPRLAFRAAGLGAGFSSVAVVGERIYTLGDLEDGQYVLALSRADGSRLWKTRIGPVWDDGYGGPRSTPTLDGDRLYALGTEGDVVCLDAATGEPRWSRSLPREFGGVLMKAMGTTDWKFSESPLVDGDRVIVTPGAAGAVMVALDKTTGEELWRAQLPDLGKEGVPGAGYSSAVVSEGGGLRHYVQLVGKGAIGVEAASGRFLWGYNRVANEIANIPTPLVSGDHVFVSSGYGTGAALLKLRREGDGLAAEEVYFLAGETMQNHHGGLILDGDHVYTGSGHNKGFPMAVELASGAVAWGPVRNEGKSSAAISYADGRIYFRYQDGRMILVEATPEAYREHGTFEIPEVTKPSWSHPVIAGARLYLREQDNLFVYDVSATTAAAEAP